MGVNLQKSGGENCLTPPKWMVKIMGENFMVPKPMNKWMIRRVFSHDFWFNTPAFFSKADKSKHMKFKGSTERNEGTPDGVLLFISRWWFQIHSCKLT